MAYLKTGKRNKVVERNVVIIGAKSGKLFSLHAALSYVTGYAEKKPKFNYNADKKAV